MAVAGVLGRRRETLTQLGRFAVVGSFTTGLSTITFVALDTFTRAPLQACNFAGYLAALTSGYALHSRITFRNHGRRDWGSALRFWLASLPSFALNAFWTWLLGTALRLPHWTVQVPIWFVTPFLIFFINRLWVFR